MTVAQGALVAIAVAFVAAEIVRPTHVPAKHLVSHSLVLGPSLLGAEMLDDLPRIHPDALGSIAPATLSRSASGTTLHLRGWIADPYTRRPGLTVFTFANGARVADASVRYHLPTPPIAPDERGAVPKAAGFEVDQPWHGRVDPTTLAVGLVAVDQRGFYLLPAVQPPGSQVTPAP